MQIDSLGTGKIHPTPQTLNSPTGYIQIILPGSKNLSLYNGRKCTAQQNDKLLYFADLHTAQE